MVCSSARTSLTTRPDAKSLPAMHLRARAVSGTTLQAERATGIGPAVSQPDCVRAHPGLKGHPATQEEANLLAYAHLLMHRS